MPEEPNRMGYSRYQRLCKDLIKWPHVWLVTGVAGFIGSNLLETLLLLDQTVVGLDNFATGHQRNLHEVQASVAPQQWARFRLLEGDICRMEDCRAACEGTEYILHQAALGSVPRSLKDPVRFNAVNVGGFINVLEAARECQVKRVIYASSSSVYGDECTLPKVEPKTGRPLSPYAATKQVNELYAEMFWRCFKLNSVGLRYFNVFGPRQDPQGAYAAVIPKWIRAMLDQSETIINGDGETTRDFCYVDNVVQANLLAATEPSLSAGSAVFNIACGERASLRHLHDHIRSLVLASDPSRKTRDPQFAPERPADVRHSLANIDAARRQLGYEPIHNLEGGLAKTTEWHLRMARS